MEPEVETRGRRNAFVFLGALLLVLGVALPHPPFFAAGASLLAYLVASLAYVHRAIRRVGAVRLAPSTAFEGDDVEVEVRLTNFGRLPILGVELVDHFTPQSVSLVRILVPERLAPRSIYALRYAGNCFKKRGRYELGPMEVRVSDPLGLFSERRTFLDPDEIVLYPATVEVGELPAKGSRPAVGTGLSVRARPGLSPVYRGVRDYRPGDEPRFIHWALSARHGKILVRDFDAEVRGELAIFLDLDRANSRGLGACSTLEYGVKAAASLAASVARRRVQVGLVWAGSGGVLEIPTGSTRRHVARILDALVGVKMEGTVRLADLVREHAGRLSPASSVAIVFAGAPEEPADFGTIVEGLAQGGHAVLAVLLDRDSFLAVTQEEVGRGARPETADFARLLAERGAAVSVVSGARELAGQLDRPWERGAPWTR